MHNRFLNLLLTPFSHKQADCLSAEEEAADLQKIMQAKPGEIPIDRDEMMEMM